MLNVFAGRADNYSMGDPIRLRYDSTCGTCATRLTAGAPAVYDRETKSTTCMVCVESGAVAVAPSCQDGGAEVVAETESSEMIRLRYPGTCLDCGAVLKVGTAARYDRQAKTVRCLECQPAAGAAPLDVGIAGGSARVIANRQQAKRDQRKAAEEAAIRQAMPRLGGLVVGVRRILAEPEKPTSWQRGADGEEAVGRTFGRLADEGFVMLHDRRKPGTRWNIDHVVVGPRGVYVIDAKHYSGRLEIRSTGTIFRPGPNRVFVRGRPQDKRVAAMDWQIDIVREAVADLLDGTGAVCKPVLCFLGVDLGFNQQPMLVGDNDVLVTWPRRFVKDIGRDGPLTSAQIDVVARRIAEKLPAAAA